MGNVLIYESIWNITERLSDEQTGKLFKAINAWRKNDEIILDDLLLEGIWLGIEPNLISLFGNYQKKVELNKSNGKKGGRPKTQPNPENPDGFTETHNNPNGFMETQPNPENLKEKEKEKDKDKEKDKEIEKDRDKDRDMKNRIDIFNLDMFSKEAQDLADVELNKLLNK